MTNHEIENDENVNDGPGPIESDNGDQDKPVVNKTFLGNLRISTRIAILVGSAIFAMSALGGVYAVGESRSNEAIDTEEAFVSLEEYVIGVDISALQMRHTVRAR